MSEAAEMLTQRRARWRAEEDAARRTPGHVFAICQRCGESWPVSVPPPYCRRCASAVIMATGPCPGCEHCAPAGGECACPPGECHAAGAPGCYFGAVVAGGEGA